jgi:SagB-type dehydrogenase family enzyme
VKNQDIEAARQYHDGTKHSHHSIRTVPHFLDWPNQPLAFKLYRDLVPLALPKDFEPSTAPALDAIASTGVEPDDEKEPDLHDLARIFYFSAGITRIKSHPGGQILFRAAPCTGALYHVELYLACRNLPGLGAGLYHFGPSDFGLRRLRSGDWRSVIVEASGNEPSLAAAPAIVLFTSTFWRNSWKYRQRAYRHCYWDSGTLMANLLAVAATRELPARLVLGFEDEPINRLIDVDPSREVTLGLVALGRTAAAPAPPPGPVEPLGYETVALSPAEVDYPEIREMHQASALDSAEEAARWRGASPTSRDSKSNGPLFPLAPVAVSDRPRDPLEEVIRRRGSTRRFARVAISLAELSIILDRATQGVPADFLDPVGTGTNDLYLIVNAVDGLPSGAYFYRREQAALEQLKEGDFRSEAGYLDLEQELAADASINIYLMSDLRPVLERFGNRGYRAAELEGGVLGGKIYLAAYAQKLGASGLTFYDDDVTRFFSPHAEGKSVMFLVAVGRSARRAVLHER